MTEAHLLQVLEVLQKKHFIKCWVLWKSISFQVLACMVQGYKVIIHSQRLKFSEIPVSEEGHLSNTNKL